MKKCLITGGAGFIGSHIAEHLANQGSNIIVLDSLRTGFEKNLEGLNVNFIKGDIRDEKLVEDLTKGCETIFHLAALVSVPESLLKTKECIDINTIGTINILESAKKNQNCKVILSSSAANYGDNPVLPKLESMSPEPMTPYAITKLDGTAKGGVVIGISDEFKIPVKYIGVGEKVEDLQVFNKVEFVNSLFKRG